MLGQDLFCLRQRDLSQTHSFTFINSFLLNKKVQEISPLIFPKMLGKSVNIRFTHTAS